MSLRTRITSLFGLKYPVMSAPMSRHSGGRLAGAMTKAGGPGLFGATNPAGEGWLHGEIARARGISEGGPFGVGFITHLIPVFPSLLDVALEERVPVIAFSFADPSPWIERTKAAGSKVICQVQDIAGAEQAVRAGTDVLAVQGNEAGGHTGRSNLFPLLLRVLHDFPDVPVLAAGGIASGRALASALTAGADGAWLGTAMLATPECDEVSMSYKQKLVDAKSEDTVFTEVFDILDVAAFGIPPWPEKIAGRAIANGFLHTWHGKEASLRAQIDEILPEYQLSLAQNDIDKTAIWAGESVDQISKIRPVAEIVQTICEDAARILKT